MAVAARRRRAPEHVVVVGAGIAGLSIAWFLQERGVRVTVLERSAVAAGSSWGNAGWITPGMAVPLAEPAVLRYGVKALLDPDAPLHVPIRVDPHLWAFLTRFAAHCTGRSWRRTMAALAPINRLALDAYAQLEAGTGLGVRAQHGPIVTAFARPQQAEGLLQELAQIQAAGMDVRHAEIGQEELRSLVPIVSPAVTRAIRIDGQAFLHPGPYVAALAEAVSERGGEVREGAEVGALRHGAGGIQVDVVGAAAVSCDAVVLATGAWLPQLARDHGVRTMLRAGRGYSFSVPQSADPARDLRVPVYFQHERVVCTPIGARVRIGGTMDFHRLGSPLDQARIDTIVRAVAPLVDGLDLGAIEDEWVGPRPLSVDGLPLVGASQVPGVWVHGGHGMWGMCQGPATARLLAEQMVTGVVPEELRPLDPTR